MRVLMMRMLMLIIAADFLLFFEFLRPKKRPPKRPSWEAQISSKIVLTLEREHRKWAWLTRVFTYKFEVVGGMNARLTRVWTDKLQATG